MKFWQRFKVSECTAIFLAQIPSNWLKAVGKACYFSFVVFRVLQNADRNKKINAVVSQTGRVVSQTGKAVGMHKTEFYFQL